MMLTVYSPPFLLPKAHAWLPPKIIRHTKGTLKTAVWDVPADVVAGYGGGEAFCSLRISLHFLMGWCPQAVNLTRVRQPPCPPSGEAGRIAGARFTHLSSPQVTGCNSKASHEGRSLIKEEKAPCVFQNASSLACSLPLPWTPGEGSLPAEFTVRTW